MTLTYRVIKFSHDNGFWITKEFYSDYNTALSAFNEAKVDPEFHGGVFLAIEHERYAIVKEFGMEGYRIEVCPLFSITIARETRQLQPV